MPDTDPAPRPDFATIFWGPVNKAWLRLDSKVAVNRMTLIPSIDNISGVDTRVILFNLALSDIMLEDDYTHADIAAWTAALMALLDRLCFQMNDLPEPVARNMAAFVAATSPEFCRTFENRQHIRVKVLAVYVELDGLVGIVLPDLQAARARRDAPPQAPDQYMEG